MEELEEAAMGISPSVARSAVIAAVQEALRITDSPPKDVVDALSDNLELAVDAKVREFMQSAAAYRKKVEERLKMVRLAADQERKVNDTASKHREAEAVRIEVTRLQEKYDTDLTLKSEKLSHAQYMNNLLTKEIYFLMEKNSELTAEGEQERKHIAELEVTIEKLRKEGIGRPKSRVLSRKHRVRTPGTPSPDKTFVTLPNSRDARTTSSTSLRRGSRKGSIESRSFPSSHDAARGSMSDFLYLPSLLPPALQSSTPDPFPPAAMEHEELSTPPPEQVPLVAETDESPLALPTEHPSETPPELVPAPEEPMPAPVEVPPEPEEFIGPSLPPHLINSNDVVNPEVLKRKVLDEDHERIKQTIIESYGIRKSIVSDMSMQDLMSMYNKKDDEYVLKNVPKYHRRGSYNPKTIEHVPYHHSPVGSSQGRRRSSFTVKNEMSTQTEALFTGMTAELHRHHPASMKAVHVQTEPPHVATKGSQTSGLSKQSRGAIRKQGSPMSDDRSDHHAGIHLDPDDESINSETTEMFESRSFEKQLSELKLCSEILRADKANLEAQLKEGNDRLALVEDLSERRRLRIEQLETLRVKLEATIEEQRIALIDKENAHTVNTHERDVLLRELSQQLYDARASIDVLRRKLKNTAVHVSIEPKSRLKTPLTLSLKSMADELRTQSPPEGAALVSASLPNLHMPLTSASSPVLLHRGKSARCHVSIADDLKNMVGDLKGDPAYGSPKKKGIKYYSSGPELLITLKNEKTGTLRVSEDKAKRTPITLDDADMLKLHAMRKEIVEKIVDKTSTLKSLH